MFDKILIANRGEIAVRIARTARRLGIASAAVYSDADRDALHVEVCDEAFHIGAASPAESYLNAERVLQTALDCGAAAIHPGYGFLSENAAFARACEAAGIVFIGPPASAIEAMGSKSEAKVLMETAGVPLIPGYHGADQDETRLAEESRRVGYPQLIKASAGGGGKGMRLVSRDAEFSDALSSARREARAAFGSDDVLIERYLARPRHVELQVFADSHGNCVHLFERDCSIQRRHQKILEEAPAPGLDDRLRGQMGAAAVDCARAIDYRGAGTVEFLLDADGEFYFMEMNTRLQVEHPVTEMITGLDLVEWQLRVAAGEALPCAQQDISMRGHAFEARIYAETPARDFMPAAGRIGYLELPSGEARVDTGVRSGDSIGINYDPMIAKLIVHGDDRSHALARLAQALGQYRILGLYTNLDFLGRLVAMPEFAAADFDTGFIAQHHSRLFARDEYWVTRAALLAVASLLPVFKAAEAGASPWDSRDHWRMNLPRGERRRLVLDGESLQVDVECVGGSWMFRCGEREYAVDAHWLDGRRMRAEIGGELLECAVLHGEETVEIACQGQIYCFQLPPARQRSAVDAAAAGQPRAPMSGAVVAVAVAPGDHVEAGDTLVVIEAMKMEHAIVAPATAVVTEVLFAAGDQVDENEILVNLEVD